MDFRVLNYFLTVAQEKTISKAAESLHLSQPTLSKQLKELEEELGVQLFTRGNREITLTEDGHYLVNRGKEILSLVDTTMTNLSSNETISGEIVIGGGETKAMQFIAESVRVLTEEYPDVKIHLYSGNADDVSEKLDKGILDFGIVIDPVEKKKYDYLRLPRTDHWGILFHNDHPYAKKEAILPDDLQFLSLFVSSQSLVDNQIGDWMGKNLESQQIIGTYNLLYNASIMVREGIGCALCIDGIINTQGTNLTFVPLRPRLEANLNMIWKKNAIHSKAATVFLNAIQTSIHL
ncbi:LysR family transcriptional regulator [Carnobacterium sp. 17-4]|uniref:LysR family transcriptional regulator n=1 Tax=Carnobacterium sp. (strain 17-4) TaxID=208596 RepID=UPI0003025B8E|nr:LysR family transcriptional regulator [Carnobacterium sp. 17-4]